MERIDFQAVFIDLLWLLGAAGALATFSYHDWKRSVLNQSWRHNWKLPGVLFPLNLSLTILCLGVTLNRETSYASAPWWQTAIGLVITSVFGVQTYLYWRNRSDQ